MIFHWALIVEKGEFVLVIVDGSLDPFVRHLEKVNVLFDPDKLPPEVDAGDARRAGTHEGVQNGSSFRAGNPNQTFQQFNRLLARVQTVRAWNRAHVPHVGVMIIHFVKIPEFFVLLPEFFVLLPETEGLVNRIIDFFGWDRELAVLEVVPEQIGRLPEDFSVLPRDGFGSQTEPGNFFGVPLLQRHEAGRVREYPVQTGQITRSLSRVGVEEVQAVLADREPGTQTVIFSIFPRLSAERVTFIPDTKRNENKRRFPSDFV